MDLELIQQLAQQDDLTSYEGQDASGIYTGYGDDLVDFGGNNVDFATEVATDRVFQMAVENTTGTDQLVILNPSYSPSVPAMVIRNGVIITGLEGKGNPRPIQEFLEFIKLNPTNVVAVKVTSSNSLQLQQTFFITRKSPFRSLQDENIPIISYTTEFANNDKQVTIRRPFQLDNQTELSLNIPSGTVGAPTVTTIQFFCGAVLNTAKALDSKTKRAGRNPLVAQVRAQVAAGK